MNKNLFECKMINKNRFMLRKLNTNYKGDVYMKIYTKTGDSGKTSLYDGNRVYKDDIRVEAYGDVDELNAFIGDSVNYLKEEDKQVLRSIQRKLFDVGGELATKEEGKFKNTIKEEDVKVLEDIIDEYMSKLEICKLSHYLGLAKLLVNYI